MRCQKNKKKKTQNRHTRSSKPNDTALVGNESRKSEQREHPNVQQQTMPDGLPSENKTVRLTISNKSSTKNRHAASARRNDAIDARNKRRYSNDARSWPHETLCTQASPEQNERCCYLKRRARPQPTSGHFQMSWHVVQSASTNRRCETSGRKHATRKHSAQPRRMSENKSRLSTTNNAQTTAQLMPIPKCVKNQSAKKKKKKRE